MIKKIILLALFSIFLADAYAQVNTDSLAYQLQRKKINGMLEVRRQKFGQYDQSLSQHTGIFGLQTKKDIEHSNDILMDIVKTDNDIFQQLKILLDYRTFAQKQVESHSSQADSSNMSYMNTINRLQAQTAKLESELDKADQEQQKKSQTTMIIVIGLIVVVVFLLRARFVKKRT